MFKKVSRKVTSRKLLGKVQNVMRRLSRPGVGMHKYVLTRRAKRLCRPTGRPMGQVAHFACGSIHIPSVEVPATRIPTKSTNSPVTLQTSSPVMIAHCFGHFPPRRKLKQRYRGLYSGERSLAENSATELLGEDRKGRGTLAVGLKRERAYIGIQYPQYCAWMLCIGNFVYAAASFGLCVDS